MKRLLLPLLAAFIFPLKVMSIDYQIREDYMTDKKQIIFMILSENKVLNSIGQKKSAAMAVICTNGDPKLVFNTPTFNAKNQYLGIRWDKEKPKYSMFKWSRAQSSDAYFHVNPKKFINEMRKRDVLTLAWTPYKKGEQAVKFDLNSQNWKADIEQSIKDGCNL